MTAVASGAGQTTLQGAYNNSPTPGAQILLDAVPNPFSVQAQVAGTIVEWLDIAGNPVLRVTADPDEVEIDGRLVIEDPFLNAGAANSIVMTDNVTYTAGFVGGGILSNGTVQYNNAVWIWALLQESKLYRANVAPGFAAFTLFNAICTIENQGNFDLVQALVLNVGVTHNRRTSGTSTVIQTIGVSFAAQTRASVSGATMTRSTGMTGLNMAPSYNTVLGSTVNLGTIIGLNCNQPVIPLFGSGAGVENITAYYGLNWNNMTFGGAAAVSSVVRSNQASGTNRRFLDHTGTAVSRHVGNFRLEADFPNGTLNFGADLDVACGWVDGTSQWYFQINTPAVSQMRFASPAVDRIVWSHALAQGEFNIQCDRFSLGQQSGANGNQVGNFVTPARTIGVGGDWADFLLTQGGNITVGGLAMGRVSAWVINPISYASSSGSVANADTLTVGGFPTSSPGVTITERQSLFVIAGRSRFRSSMQYDPINPAALAAGNNNDWAGLLTGTNNNNMRHWARVTPDGGGTSVITGIDSTAAQDGDTFKLTNIGTVNFAINHNDVASTAGNRILTYTVANLTVGPNESVEVTYDATTGAWRVLYGSA